MSDFFIINCIGATLIAITSVINYEFLRYTWQLLPKMRGQPQLRILLVIAMVFIAHIIAIWIYGAAYWFLGQHIDLGHFYGDGVSGETVSLYFISALYFSSTTYSSLGFGDILPNGMIRMLAAAEVLNGLVLIGWSVSFTYLVMLKFWDLPHGRQK